VCNLSYFQSTGDKLDRNFHICLMQNSVQMDMLLSNFHYKNSRIEKRMKDMMIEKRKACKAAGMECIDQLNSDSIDQGNFTRISLKYY
jgi:hypothetical protein